VAEEYGGATQGALSFGCQVLHNAAFLPYLERRDTERSAAAFDRWFERASLLDRVALPGG
jgi:hypothetical protein